MEHLLFRLHGPLASWGQEAVGELRPTSPHPSKSAVLGLVAAALGIDYSEDGPHTRLASETGFAVRTDRGGSTMRDFHTAEAPRGRRMPHWLTRRDEIDALTRKDNPVISRRDYVCDALYTVCLWARSETPSYPLGAMRDALDTPVYVPYLGRKSCPLALPMQPRLVEAPTLVAAFSQATFADEWDVSAIGHYDGAHGDERDLHFDTHPSPGIEIVHEVPRRDEISSRTRRQHRLRQEVYARIPQNSTEVAKNAL